MTLTPGTHRLRFVSIPVDEQIAVAFVRDSVVREWRSLARDGAELPVAQQVIGEGGAPSALVRRLMWK
ncbi:MAG: hypothetical protein ABMA00_13265 [Gemmatimonas sp.]